MPFKCFTYFITYLSTFNTRLNTSNCINNIFSLSIKFTLLQQLFHNLSFLYLFASNNSLSLLCPHINSLFLSDFRFNFIIHKHQMLFNYWLKKVYNLRRNTEFNKTSFIYLCVSASINKRISYELNYLWLYMY